MSDIENINNALVFEGSDGEPFTTSLVIATETGNQHQNVVELIRDNLADLSELGIVRFETGKFSDGPGRPTTYELPAPTIRVTAKGIGKLHELMGGTEPIRFVVAEAS